MQDRETIRQVNEELARRINEETRANPDSPYRGKFVGLANGQVVAVTDNLDELVRRLEEIEPDPARTFGLEASRDYDEVHMIWGCR